MTNDLLYRIALTLVPHIGPVQAKILLQHGEPEEIFHARKSFLEKIEGIGSVRAASIRSFKDFDAAEKEIRFLENHRVQPLFISDPVYPKRLLNCYDSPTLLYYKGTADLNAAKIISIIGTRNHTEYGRAVTEKLLQDLSVLPVLVVSGLAFGIDALAHKAALRNQLPTVGVLAHGLDQLYPPEHRGLAREMLQGKGGLLTEFRSHTKPDKHHFPSRNRIVAGISDATIVIETDIKGGSMITAELADSYNRDVFAFPGKVTDNKSAGCHHLIKNNKAILLTGAQQLIETMGWEEKKQEKTKIQRELFIELSSDEKIICRLLRENETLPIDELTLRSGLSSSAVAAAILNLELQNVVVSLPGKRFRIT